MRCAQCVEIIITAKERQEKEANKHAEILLKQIDEERKQKEKKERKREKKKEKAAEKKKNKKNKNLTESAENVAAGVATSTIDKIKFDDEEEKENISGNMASDSAMSDPIIATVDDGESNTPSVALPTPVISADSGADTTPSTTSPVTSENIKKPKKRQRGGASKEETKKDEPVSCQLPASGDTSPDVSHDLGCHLDSADRIPKLPSVEVITPTPASTTSKKPAEPVKPERPRRGKNSKQPPNKTEQKTLVFVNSELKVTPAEPAPTKKPVKKYEPEPVTPVTVSIPQPSVTVPIGSSEISVDPWNIVKTKKPVRKLTLASNLIARVIGRSGCNVNAIRDVTQTHIDIEKPKKGGGDRTITIRGNNDSTTMAYTLMEELINHPDKEIEDIIAHHFPTESKKRREKEKATKEIEIEAKKEEAKMVSIQDALAAVALNEKAMSDKQRAKDIELAKKKEKEMAQKAKEEAHAKLMREQVAAAQKTAELQAARTGMSLSTPSTPRNKPEHPSDIASRSVGKREKPHVTEYAPPPAVSTKDQEKLDAELSKHLRNLHMRDQQRVNRSVSTSGTVTTTSEPIITADNHQPPEPKFSFVDPSDDSKPFADTWVVPPTEPIKEVIEPPPKAVHPGPIGPPKKPIGPPEVIQKPIVPEQFVRTSPMPPRQTFIQPPVGFSPPGPAMPPVPMNQPGPIGSHDSAKKRLIFEPEPPKQVDPIQQVMDQPHPAGPPGFLGAGIPGLVSPIGTPRTPEIKVEKIQHPVSIAPIAPPTSRTTDQITGPILKPIMKVPPMVQPSDIMTIPTDMMPSSVFDPTNPTLPNFGQQVKLKARMKDSQIEL